MARSKAETVEAYLAGLDPERRKVVQTVRRKILENLDPDYEEGIQYGMISYHVPHRVYPAGYHVDPRQPLPFAALAAQKNYFSVYLMSLYAGCGPRTPSESPHAAWFRKEWEKTGRKRDRGKSCIRFRRLEDLPLGLIGEAIARVPARKYVALYTAALEGRPKKPKA